MHVLFTVFEKSSYSFRTNGNSSSASQVVTTRLPVTGFMSPLATLLAVSSFELSITKTDRSDFNK
jgi:hypothetical protein